MKKQFIYGLLSLTVLSGAGLSSCSSEEDFAGPKGQKVMLSITASKDAQTRTSFEETEDGLLCKWTEGDKLLVTNTSGQRLGVITLQGEGGVTTGLFKGPVTLDGNQTVNLFYLGNDKAIPETLTENAYTLDLSAQDGTFASLAVNDFMHQEADVKLLDGEATGSVMMDRRVAEGHFDLQLPGGLQLKKGDVITITQPEGTFQVAPKIYYRNGGSVVGNDNGTLTITKAEDGNDLYVTIFPQTLTPTFTIKKDGSIYTATLDSHEWVQSTYVCNTTDGSGIAVSDWTKTDIPTDPSDPNNWGGDNISEVVNYTSTLWDFSKYGLYTNCLDLRGYGGWATWIEYTNGMYGGGLLSSKTTSGFYFQWGRLMGFPSNVNSEPDVLQAGSVNSWFGEAGVGGGYATYFSDYYKLSVEDSNKYPQCFLRNKWDTSTGYDYCTTNNSCTWESRSGNPCPEGYRLPSAEEMQVFVPSTGEVKGSYAEVKNVQGQNVAIEWNVTATSGSTPGRIDIRMVKTDKTSVKAGDAIFNESAKTIRLTAYGYLINDGSFSARGEAGIYWTNDNGNAGDLLEGVSGNGGQALYFELSGTTAAIMMGGVPRNFGGCVMPIKDSKAHAIKYRPWFPYGGFWPK